MKKRLLSLILCLAMIFCAIPFGGITAVSEDAATEESTSNYNTANYGANIGHTAKFYLAEWSSFLVFDNPENFDYDVDWDNSEYWLICETGADNPDIPEDHMLVITDYYWDSQTTALWYKVKAAPGYTLPERMASYTWVFQNYTSEYELEEPAYDSILIDPSARNVIFDADGNIITAVEMSVYDVVKLTGVSTLIGKVAYQWQILIDGEWVDIYGEDEADISVTIGMLIGGLTAGADANYGAELRCVSRSGSKTATGDSIPFTVTPYVAEENEETTEAQAASLSAYSTRAARSGSVMPLADEETTEEYYYVTVQYLFENGVEAAGSDVSKVSPNAQLNRTVEFPPVQGYLPYYDNQQVNSMELNLDAVTSNITYVVYYLPAEVEYQIDVYFQNVNNDDYTFHDTRTLTGLTGSKVPDNTVSYPGMYELLHETPEIAANGSTRVEVRFNRVYYLIDFDLDGGHSVHPIYARYGTPLTDYTPIKPGYAFVGWDDITDGTGDGIADTLPTTVPAENRTYKAIWKAEPTAEVKVVFWGENPNDKTYSYLQSDTLQVKPGTVLTYGSDDYICGFEEHTHDTSCTNRCGMQEHTHEDDCYNLICGKTEHNHDDNCCSEISNHSSHTTACYSNVGTEATPNNPPRDPTTGQIYETRWNGNKYIYINDTWYTYTGSASGNSTVTADQCTLNGHTHTDECWICNQEEHTHTDYTGACYELTCEETEHTHDAACYSNCLQHTHSDETCKIGTFDGFDERKWEFVSSDTVTVAVDGTTVLNVYYKPKEYTLRFYYAATTGTGSDTDGDGVADTYDSVMIIGGSTYSFGSKGENTSDDEKLLNSIFNETNKVGEVTKLPQLNATGKARNYTFGTLTSGDNSYHYIEFTAGYGQDISELWPCAVFESATRKDTENASDWDGDQAFVSAWNGEHHVRYSQKNANETIKGKYEILDDLLLFDPTFDNETTVSYLCFWENGTGKVDWNVPKLFVYNIWVAASEGEDLSGVTTTEFNGVLYKLIDTYDTCDDSDPAGQTQPALEGYHAVTSVGTQITLSDEQKEMYSDGYKMDFYYEGNEYYLEFFSGTNAVRQETMVFNQSLESFADYIPAYPDEYEVGERYFAGWYLNEDCTGEKVDLSTKTMPANNLALYAKWEPKYHTVKIYDEKKDDGSFGNQLGETQNVLHGQLATAPETPVKAPYKFLGWFYMVGTTEQMWDFENTTVVGDTEIYAKWSSDVLVPYTVYFAVEDENGKVTYIADPITGSAPAGTTVTFSAKTTTDLYEEYQKGYYPNYASSSLTMDVTQAEKGMTFTFFYQSKEKAPYTVYYVDEQGNDLISPKEVPDNTLSVVTERFQTIQGYVPDAISKVLILSALVENKITFVYTKNTTDGVYRITHHTQNTDGQTFSVHSSVEAYGKIGTEMSETPLDLTGFTFSYAEVNGTRVTAVADIKGTVTDTGLQIDLYYTRNKYGYTVRYLNADNTSETLAEDVVVNPENGAYYGTAVTATGDQVKTIENYTLSSTGSCVIQDDETKNVINVLYSENTVQILYKVVGPDGCGSVTPTQADVKILTGSATSSTAAANQDYVFVGWYSDEACLNQITDDVTLVLERPDDGWQAATYYAKFEPNGQDLTIIRTGFTDPDQVFVYEVKNNTTGLTIYVTVTGKDDTTKQVTIQDLPLGTYTITQMNDWSWRYGDAAREVQHTNPAEVTIVTFDDTPTQNQWLSGNSTVVVNQFQEVSS